MFDDLLQANRRYSAERHDPEVKGVAGRGLAVLTCMDARIDPLAVLGLQVGDAKIFRNAGARVTDDALRCLVLATNLLGATRICVIQHTSCAMMGPTDDEMRARVADASGKDTSGWEFLASADPLGALRDDVAKIRACPLIPDDTEIGGFVFDVHSGKLDPIDS